MQKPEWLPDMVAVNGEPNAIFATLYRIFRGDFIDAVCHYHSCRIIWDRRRLDGPYDEGFWHLITRDIGGVRLLDTRRSERLPWCAPTIQHDSESCVVAWDAPARTKGARVRTHLWLRDYDYIVVLERNPSGNGPVWLVTAYHVDGPASARKLEEQLRQSKSRHALA
jgi:hypothetical protein